MLTIDNISVYYDQSRILNEVALQIAPGQAVCVLGRNGVGKTTLLKTIMGLLRPRAGHIAFGDQDITSMPPHARAHMGIGYVPQGRGIFPYLTVYENLLMGFEATRAQTNDALDEVYSFFPVLKQMGRRVAGVLSGGQQQQLAIARALVRRPTLLLLDEPTEGIQPSIVQEIEDVIRRLEQRGDMAILLIEQFLDFAISATSFYYILEKGHVVASGSSDQMNQAIVSQYLAV